MFPCAPVRAGTWILTCVLLLCPGDLLAQPADRRAKDEAAIRQAGKDYLTAIDHGDTKALVDAWTADGTYADETGRTVRVQDLLAKKSDQNRTPPRSMNANAKVRFITDDVALEEGDFYSPADDEGKPVGGRYSALWVRNDGRWKLDNVRELRIESAASPDQLASLDVFKGEWSGEVSKITIHVSAKWDANKKFLRREIKMTSGEASLVSMQVIGWDPLKQQIRSWTFSDDGSYSDGVWSMEGNKWMVAATRVLPDQRISEVTQVYKFSDKNTLIWKLIRGSVDGQPTDDFEVVLKRSTAN